MNARAARSSRWLAAGPAASAVACAALLGGCASCGPLRAAWYWVDEVPAGAIAAAMPPHAGGIRLALLNQGERPAVLTGVVLNASDGDAGWAWGAGKSTLQPGLLAVFQVADFRDVHHNPFSTVCRLPVRVQIHCEGVRRPLDMTFPDAMPTALADGWIDGCPP